MEAAKGQDDPVVPKWVLFPRPSFSLFHFLWVSNRLGNALRLVIVGRVFLHATDQSALQNGITMESLKKFAAEPEAAGGGGSLEKNAPIQPGTKGGVARETH